MDGSTAYVPLWLRDADMVNDNGYGRRPNLSGAAQRYLNRLGATGEDLFHHVLATLHDPAYRQAYAGALRMEWPRIPLPGWPDGPGRGVTDALAESAARGRTLAALLDPDTPVPGVTQGPLRPQISAIAVPATIAGHNMVPNDFAVTAGWGHYGKDDAVMPGQGHAVERTYTLEERTALGNGLSALGETTFDVYLNATASGATSLPPSGTTSSVATKCSRNGCLTVNVPSADARCASRKSSNSLTRHVGLQR